MLSRDEQFDALRLARRAVSRAVGAATGQDPRESVALDALPQVFAEKRGVFVSLKRHPDHALRGCIGYPLPVLPLGTAISQAAVAAATDDPRFPAVRAAEMSRVVFEVSVLSIPVPIPPARPEILASEVAVGRDGLIVEGYGTSGLLLPQVAVEQGWTAEELLAGACEKAGLPRGAWRQSRVTIRRFQAEVFRERSPGGEVVEESPSVSSPDGPPVRRT